MAPADDQIDVLGAHDDGRVVNAAVLIATGVNVDGHRKSLGVQDTTSETGPARLIPFQDLVACGQFRSSTGATSGSSSSPRPASRSSLTPRK